MDIDTFRGIVTALLMLLFIALVIWAYSRRRHDEFNAAAQLPLEDDDAPPTADPIARDAQAGALGRVRVESQGTRLRSPRNRHGVSARGDVADRADAAGSDLR